MSKRRRLYALRAIGGLYKRMECALDVCWYCGDLRESLDHVPPLNITVDMDIEEFRRRGGLFLLVPCCLDCNCALGAQKLGTPAERAGYLYEWYHKRIEKLFRGWTQDEIDELGRGLQQAIIARRWRANEYIRKLRGLENRLFWLSL